MTSTIIRGSVVIVTLVKSTGGGEITEYSVKVDTALFRRAEKQLELSISAGFRLRKRLLPRSAGEKPPLLPDYCADLPLVDLIQCF